MAFRYLFGPVDAAFADQNLHEPRAAGDCLAFNATGAGVDLAVGPADAWADVEARLPAGWRPDCVILDLGYTTVPAGLWRAPVPLVGLASDWNLLWHWYRHALPRCELVLADSAGVEVMRRQGWGHARAACLYGPGRAWLELPDDAGGERDIDVLFVGNLHPAVQRARLPWLGRLAGLAGRRNVVLRTGVFRDDYRALLRRTKVAFNRSIRCECNQRAFEAASAGALLFQEAGNREVTDFFEPNKEYVPYGDDNLEALLDRYLDRADERRAIAEAARRRVSGHGYAALLQRALAAVPEAEWAGLRERAARRATADRDDELLGRVWQACGSRQRDEALAADLAARLKAVAPPAALHNALGVATALGPPSRPGVAAAAPHFERAVLAAGGHAVAALNHVEALTLLGEKDRAAAAARRLLARLAAGDVDPASWDAVHFPATFDHFRVEWERAAWSHAGDPAGEMREKGALLRWQTHTTLAELTGDLSHFHEAALARPDLPVGRAALGCALGRAGRPAEAAAHLDVAVADNPFDLAAARALFQARVDCGDGAGAVRLAGERRRLARAAPDAVPGEVWFAEPPTPPAEAGEALRLAWEGPLLDRHSLGLVNRELGRRLFARGHTVRAVPRDRHPPAGEPPAALRPLLAGELPGPAEVYVRMEWPPNWEAPPPGRWVVYQPWEFGSLPRDWVGPLAGPVDEVWVPSGWVRDCFVASGVPAGKVFVVPHGVDPERFRPGLPPAALRTRKRFKFLFVGGTIYRKGVDLLLKTYARAFRREDDVCLVVKDMGVGTFYRGQTAEAAVARLRDDPAAPEVEYLDGELADEDVPGLYAACDCLVHPYRGEGFGLPIAEAMACGLAVIVTGYGAALDFCDEATAYLLPARVRRIGKQRPGDPPTVAEPWLAEPDRDALQALLRHVADHPDEARAKGAVAAEHIRSHFTWARAAEVAEARLLQLRQRPVRRATAGAAPHRPAVPAAPAPMPAADVIVSSSRWRPRVSLCLIVKNEEDNLPACLGSAADLVDEVVVVDTGSTDKTKEVAARFGAKVVDFPWVDSFSAARNESLRHATGEWVFWLDADDRLDEDNRAKLRRLFAGLGGENAAYAMKCLCVARGPGDAATAVDHVRLFRNRPDVRWSYRVHEQILPAVRKAGGEVRWADVVIQHTGYQDPALRHKKLERDLRLLKLEQAEQPDDPFTLFNLGQVNRELGDFAGALPLLRRSLERSHPADSIVRKLYALIVECQRRLGQAEQAYRTCAEGLQVCPDDAELLFLRGILLRDRGDLAGAAAAWERLLTAKPAAHFASVDASMSGPKARNNLAVVYRQLGRDAEAEALWRQVVAGQPDFAPARMGLAELALERGDWAALDDEAAKLESDCAAATEAAVLRARGELARKEFAAARQRLEAAIAAAPAALWPRVVLSHVLLQQGADEPAAERALQDVLEIDPNHKEARHNLGVLLSERERRRASVDAVFAGNVGLSDLYYSACRTPSHLNEHLPALVVLAGGCRHLTEFGTGTGNATTALLYTQPDHLVTYDRLRFPQLDRLRLVAGRTDFTTREADVLWTEIEETDLLFIDTLHDYEQLTQELSLHAAKVRRYIVLAGTTTFGETGETPGRRGLWPAVEEFLAKGKFRLKERHTHNNGLSVLERVAADETASP